MAAVSRLATGHRRRCGVVAGWSLEPCYNTYGADLEPPQIAMQLRRACCGGFEEGHGGGPHLLTHSRRALQVPAQHAFKGITISAELLRILAECLHGCGWDGAGVRCGAVRAGVGGVGCWWVGVWGAARRVGGGWPSDVRFYFSATLDDFCPHQAGARPLRTRGRLRRHAPRNRSTSGSTRVDNVLRTSLRRRC